jgi:nucleotide-binding universal stress UspA family protein
MDNGKLAFALVRDGRVLATGTQNGIVELLAATDRLGAEASGASLADKVVGKAVALIAVRSGLREIETPLASEPAIRLLRSRGIAITAVSVVPNIMNRAGDGLCPLEQLTSPFDEPEPALAKLREFFEAKRRAAAERRAAGAP